MWQNLWRDYKVYAMHFRSYSSGMDWKNLRLTLTDRIEKQHKQHIVQDMIPVAKEVLNFGMLLIQGVSILLQAIPTVSCKFCSEVYVGEEGHLIQTCGGYRGFPKNRNHQWIPASLNDIFVPVDISRLNNTFQKHDQRCEFAHFPALVELCRQAGVDFNIDSLCPDTKSLYGALSVKNKTNMSPEDLNFLANGTLRAWETLRFGVKKLLLVYQAKACKYCSEVHVGPLRHRPHLHQIFKHESSHESHFWQKAGVNDLVPQKIVWHQRPHDPPVLLHKGKGFYGHAPAVVSLCAKAGARVPPKYHYMMKIQGLRAPI